MKITFDLSATTDFIFDWNHKLKTLSHDDEKPNEIAIRVDQLTRISEVMSVNYIVFKTEDLLRIVEDIIEGITSN